MEDQLSGYLEELVQALREGGQFAMQELPLFLEEYLNWAIVSHTAGVLIGIVLLVVAYKAIIFILREYPKHEEGQYWDDWHDRWMHQRSMTPKGVTQSVSALVGVLGGVPVFLTHIFQLGKVLVAPRVYLIENLTSLL